MQATELDPSLHDYTFDPETEDLKARLQGVTNESLILSEFAKLRGGTAEIDLDGIDFDGDDELLYEDPPADAAPPAEFIRSLKARLAEIDREKDEAYPHLRTAGEALFERFKDRVEHGVFQEGETPFDRLSVQTEDGLRIDLTKSPNNTASIDAFLKIKYVLDGVITDITVSRTKRNNGTGADMVVVEADRAIVNFHEDDKPLLTNASMKASHSDTLTGLLDNATPIPAGPRRG